MSISDLIEEGVGHTYSTNRCGARKNRKRDQDGGNTRNELREELHLTICGVELVWMNELDVMLSPSPLTPFLYTVIGCHPLALAPHSS